MSVHYIQLLDVNVHYLDGKISFSGSDYHDGTIKIDGPLAFIRFFLVRPQEPPVVKFPTYPIQWVTSSADGFEPMEAPASCTLRRVNDRHCMLEVVNIVEDREVSFRFFVIVQNGTQFVTGDPTILNQPVGGGPCPESPD